MDKEQKIDAILALQQFLAGPHGDAVEALLAQITRAHESAWADTPHAMAYRAGRRDVWRDIQRYKRIPINQLVKE